MTRILQARVQLLWRPRQGPTREAAVSRLRKARAAVALGGLFALVAMVGMATAVETVMPEWRDPEFGHRLARLQQHQRESPERPLVLVFGTSRTQNAIYPAVMGFSDEDGSPRVFNFGQSASPPLRVHLNLLRVLDAGIRPAAVVIEVQPPWLAGDSLTAENFFSNRVDRLSTTDLRHLAAYCKNPATLRNRWLTTNLTPWYAHRLVLMSHWFPRWQPWGVRVDHQWRSMDSDGFVPFPYDEPPQHIRESATAYARKEREGSLNGFRLGTSSLTAIRDLVARCRADGISVAFVELPVSPMFRGWFRPGAWESGEAQLREFVSEIGVELFPPLDALPEADYVDGHHLLKRGATRYSRWLADTHLKPWLAREGVAP